MTGEGCSWKVVAESFESFFSGYVTALENGEFQDRIYGPDRIDCRAS